MKKIAAALFAMLGLTAAQQASAFYVSDAADGATSYWGSDSHGYGDVIGESMYDILGADVSRSGNILTIKIVTNFAGHAGSDAWAETPNGIGYGDLFLGSLWSPAGTDAHHQGDNAADDASHWTFGLSLDNRWSNTGGTFSLYSLNGGNSSNTLLSDNFLTCGLGSQCYYRNGQEVAVNTQSSTVSQTGKTGTWTVTPDSALTFTLDISGTALAQYSDIALHWGETCQNDVIEGDGHVALPEPASMALFGLGLAGIGLRRRKRMN